MFSGRVARAGKRSGRSRCISAKRSLTLLLSSADRSGVSMSVPGAVKVDDMRIDARFLHDLQAHVHEPVAGHQDVVVAGGVQDRVAVFVFGHRVCARSLPDLVDVPGRIDMVVKIDDGHGACLSCPLAYVSAPVQRIEEQLEGAVDHRNTSTL